MKLLDIKAWIIERLGGELPYDWGWKHEPATPDYYTEDGLPVYDVSKRILELEPEESSFAVLLERLPAREPSPIEWLWAERDA